MIGKNSLRVQTLCCVNVTLKGDNEMIEFKMSYYQLLTILRFAPYGFISLEQLKNSGFKELSNV